MDRGTEQSGEGQSAVWRGTWKVSSTADVWLILTDEQTEAHTVLSKAMSTVKCQSQDLNSGLSDSRAGVLARC